MSRRLIVLLACAACFSVMLGAWWLRAGDAAPDSGGGAPLARAPAASAERLDGGRLSAANATAQPVPLAATEASINAAPPAGAASSAAAIVGLAPGEMPPSATPAALHGRVLGANGAPLAGATVVAWRDTLSSESPGGLPPGAVQLALEALPRTLSDGGGWFALREDVPPPPVAPSAAGAPGGASVSSGVNPLSEASVPSGAVGHVEALEQRERRVAVLCGEFAPRSRSAKSGATASCDLGDIVLEPGGRLSGRLVDERGVPLAGAEVLCQQPRPEPLSLKVAPGDAHFGDASVFSSALTASDGRFRTGPLWNGLISLRLRAEGMQPSWRREERVVAGQSRDLGDVVLVAALTLSGRVVDAAGAPVEGALVAASPSPEGASTMSAGGFNEDSLLQDAQRAVSTGAVSTSADGSFAIPGLRRAPYDLFVVAGDFEPAHLEELQPGGLPLTVVLDRAATLRLRVLAAASEGAGAEAVTDASVDVERGGQWPDHPGVRLAVAAGPEPGTWDVRGVGAAPVQVHVTAPGRVEWRQLVDGTAPPGLVEATVELPRESLVTGRVTDTEGAPIAGAAVTLRMPPAPSPFEPAPMLPTSVAVTEADGRYALHALGAGEFALRAREDGHAAAERAVTLRAEMPLADVDFVLRALAGVSGVARYTDGSVAAGVPLAFRWMAGDGPGGGTASLKTGPDGSFARTGLAPGTWTVLRAPNQEFTLAPGEQIALDVRLTTPTRLVGQVTDAVGAPVTPALVYLTLKRPDGSLQGPQALRCDGEGRFVTSCDAGPVMLVAVSGDGALSPIAEATVREEATTVVALQIASGRAEVRLRDAGSHEPVAGARVALLPLLAGDEPAAHVNAWFEDWQLNLAVFSDDAGVARLQGIGPGRYRLEVDGIALLAQPLPPFVIGNSAPAVLDVEVVRPAVLRGVVRTADGEAPGQRCFAQLVGADGVAFRSDFVRAGRFLFQGLVPGPVTVQLTQDSRAALAEQLVVLVAGQAVDVELKLPP